MKPEKIEDERNAYAQAKGGCSVLLSTILTAIGGILLLKVIDIISNFEATSLHYAQVGGQSIVIALLAWLIYFILKDTRTRR